MRVAPFVIYICRDLNLEALSGVAVFSVEPGDIDQQSWDLVLHS